MNLVSLYEAYLSRPIWDRIPERIEFVHSGYDCLITKTPHRTLCGYVAIAETHPLMSDGSAFTNIDVHGGVTWSEYGDGKYRRAFDDEGRKLFWIGFDCAHSCDYNPGDPRLAEVLPPFNCVPVDRYRDNLFVRNQIEYMIDQIKNYDLYQ